MNAFFEMKKLIHFCELGVEIHLCTFDIFEIILEILVHFCFLKQPCLTCNLQNILINKFNLCKYFENKIIIVPKCFQKGATKD